MNLGGMEQASLRLMRARGHSFTVVSLNPMGALGHKLEEAGILRIGLNYARMGKLASFRDLRRTLALQ